MSASLIRYLAPFEKLAVSILAGLLRKVSNEIINRCRASISIREILMGALSQSISAVQAWFKM